MVITKDLSRLGRDYIQTGYYLEKYFPDNRVRYISLLDGIDTGIDSSINDITPFKALLNDMYSKDISKKIKSVKQDRLRQGLFMGYIAPYGYQKSPENKNKLVIDEDIAWVVKHIFELALQGNSPRKIAEALTLDKIQTPLAYNKYQGARDGIWGRNTVFRILTNEVYIGNLVQGRRKKINYKSKKIVYVPKEQWIRANNTHEPIIEKDVFDKVQVMLEKRTKTRSKSLDYLLKGLLTCHECGLKLSLVSARCRGNELKYYTRCNTYSRSFKAFKKCSSHTMHYEVVETEALNAVKDMCKKYLSKDYLYQVALNEKKATLEKQRYQKEINGLKAKQDALNQEIDTVYDDKLKGLISYNDFSRIYENKKAEYDGYGAKIEYLQGLINGKTSHEDTSMINKLVDDFIAMKEPTKEIIFSLIDRIEITEQKEILIFFKFRLLDEVKGIELQA